LILVLFAYLLVACDGGYFEDNTNYIVDEIEASSVNYQRYSEIFFDLFDTLTVILGYAQSQEEFRYYSREVIRTELYRLHHLFDIHNEHAGINNIWTINHNAGIKPVEVEAEIMDLIKFSIEAYHISNGTVNIALGPVTNIWREYIRAGGELGIPSMDILNNANMLTNINDVVVDEENSTIFLRHEGMSLDVGSIAKGFAIELATQKALDAGFESFTLSVGGDVRTAAAPHSGTRNAWGVGIDDPDNPGDVDRIVDVVFVTHTSVFSSGDYQRFFITNGNRYHHIINPRSLMPATNYRSVTVVHPDAGMTDVLSTVAFILDIEEAKRILASFGAEAIWVLPDMTTITTAGWQGRD